MHIENYQLFIIHINLLIMFLMNSLYVQFFTYIYFITFTKKGIIQSVKAVVINYDFSTFMKSINNQYFEIVYAYNMKYCNVQG